MVSLGPIGSHKNQYRVIWSKKESQKAIGRHVKSTWPYRFIMSHSVSKATRKVIRSQRESKGVIEIQ